MLFVLVERERPEHFGEFAARRAAQQVHLPQTVLRGRVTLREIEVCFVCGLYVRDAALVAPDGDRRMQALERQRRRVVIWRLRARNERGARRGIE